jgi:hypothetical protein
MPQVDMADLPGLLRHLWQHHRIGHVERQIAPSSLLVRQCPNPIRVCTRTELLLKPLLVSSDLYIVDGNHRWARLMLDGWPHATCIVLSAEFDRAVRAVRTFPQAYSYGDGQDHEERW